MNVSRMLLALALVGPPLVLGRGGAEARADDATLPTTPVDAHGVIAIEAVTGTVRIVGWTRAEVQISGPATLTVDHGRTRISASQDAHVEVHVPRASTLEVRGVSSDVADRDVAGTVRVETISGRILVRGESSEISARSTAGDVTVEAQPATQRVRARSVSGRVRVGGGRGAATLESVSGECLLTGGPYATIEIRSTSGSAAFEGQLAAQGTVEMRSHSGPVRLALPASTSGDFELSTFSGSIDSALGGGGGSSTGGSGRHSLHFHAGSGGPVVRASSFSGDIHVAVHP
jgi:DUF4097 and DUF4098 domain-containing protein YvlB